MEKFKNIEKKNFISIEKHINKMRKQYCVITIGFAVFVMILAMISQWVILGKETGVKGLSLVKGKVGVLSDYLSTMSEMDFIKTEELIWQIQIPWMIGVVLVMAVGQIVFIILIIRKVKRYYIQPIEAIVKKIKQEEMFEISDSDYDMKELWEIRDCLEKLSQDVSKRTKEADEIKLMAQNDRIKYLQAQTEPHFLFNVLSMIQLKAAMNQDKEVQEMLHKLSVLYQGKIFRKEESFISLFEEMEIVDFYLSLQKQRFGEKIRYSISYEGKKESYESLVVPRLSIEPIVENAVCHGIEPGNKKGNVRIKIAREGSILNVIVEDDGVGFDVTKNRRANFDSHHSNVGLWNTERMIHALCGKKFGIEVKSKIGEGTRVKVYLPIRNGEKYVESCDC